MPAIVHATEHCRRGRGKDEEEEVEGNALRVVP